MTGFIISGASLQLYAPKANFYSIIEATLLKQVLLYICLILALSIQYFIPVNKPMIQELKGYLSGLSLTLARSTISLMLLLGVGSYLVALSGSLENSDGWNLSFIGGGILSALISFRLVKFYSAYMK